MEYAVIATCVIAALVAMSVYMKRATQGRLRQAANELGEQYAPKNTIGVSNMTVDSRTVTTTTNINEQTMFDNCKAGGGSDADCLIAADLNENGQINADVFALSSKTQLINETSTQNSNETVGPLEGSLY